MIRFAPLFLALLATPALAQMDMSLMPDDPSSAEPSIDLSVEPSSETEEEISNEALPPAPSSAELFQIFYVACTSLSGGAADAYDKANQSGWVPYEGAEYGPYKRVYNGARDFRDFGSVEIWGSLETYPSQSLGYCRVDFSDVDGIFDLNAVTGIGGLTGTVGNAGANGVWETADKKLLVIAARYEGSLSIEFNVLVGDTPAP
jgi:hypothetical protein